MNGSLFDIVKRDAKFFVNKAGYQIDIEIESKDGSQIINITGWAVKHFGSFGSDGNQVNTKNIHVTIDEDVLVGLSYPVRNAKGEINLIQHKVRFIDSSGVQKSYLVRENFPDENLGLIVLILGDYKAA